MECSPREITCKLDKFKKIEIILRIFFSDHSGMKLKINYRKKNGKRISMWKQSNMLLQNQWVNDEIKEDTGKYVKTSENRNKTSLNLWMQQKQLEEKIL